MEYVPFPALN